MRAETLKRLMPAWEWRWTDTDAPMLASHRLWQSAAYRLNSGPAVDAINRLVAESISGGNIDLAWVDKAVFLYPETVQRIRDSARRTVHFTPDTAFHANRSRHFEKTIGMFDMLVTTKSFEVEEYRRRVPADRLHLTTQGFDPALHFPRRTPRQRSRSVTFVGLAEPDRERCIVSLLEHDIRVRLGGRGWKGFLTRWGRHPKLDFIGANVVGSQYAEALSSSWVGLGFLSKRFPELHTTRTFEIPACGAVLATEATPETRSYFTESEAVFFDDCADLAGTIDRLFAEASDDGLIAIASGGTRRVKSDGRDYPSILRNILGRLHIERFQLAL